MGHIIRPDGTKTTKKVKIKQMTIEQFLKFNANTESYWNHWRFRNDESEDAWMKSERAIKDAEQDLEMFYGLLKGFEDFTGVPKVGEWIKGYNGKMTRFTHAWDDGIQTGGGQGSFYLLGYYGASYSGGLDSSVPYELLELTEERKDGMFWRFHKDSSGAHRGVNYSHPCKVWKLKTIDKIEDIQKVPKHDYPVIEVTDSVRDYALDVLPPLEWDRTTGFFAMGEAFSHDGVVPTYYCFMEINGKQYCTIGTVDKAKESFAKFIGL